MIQIADINGLMVERLADEKSGKVKRGWSLPVPILEGIDGVMERMKNKEQYLVVCAAFLRFIEATEKEQNEAIARVKMAEMPGGSFEDLLPKKPVITGDSRQYGSRQKPGRGGSRG